LRQFHLWGCRMSVGNFEMVGVAAREANNLFRRSYIRGLVVFVYGLIWLAAFWAGQLLGDRWLGVAEGLPAALMAATWSAALAGGIGGTTGMLSRLYRHVSIRQDFLEQSVLLYFIQPVTGLVLGILSLYFITIPGALIVDFLGNLIELINNFSLARVTVPFTDAVASLGELSASGTFVALSILLAWTAGFYHTQGSARLKSLLKRPGAGAASETAALPAAAIDEDSPLFFKRWTQQRRLMMRWTFTWGLFILFYGLGWLLVGLLMGYLLSRDQLLAISETGSITSRLLLASWPAAIAGGLGGVFSLFYDLYQHVSVKQDFDRQHLMSYLVQPVTGFVFGWVVYLILATGYLAIAGVFSQEAGAAPTLLAAQLVLGWIAGFRQHVTAELIEGMVRGILAFFKSVAAFFNPKNLFDKTKRQERLAEAREGRQQSIFETLGQERSVWAVEERSVWGEEGEERREKLESRGEK
jgi:hypothetical protein